MNNNLGLDGGYGYGDWGNVNKLVQIQKLPLEDQKDYIKNLWQENPEKYYEWKNNFCIRLDLLPNLFGTHDNPILIDESKL